MEDNINNIFENEEEIISKNIINELKKKEFIKNVESYKISRNSNENLTIYVKIIVNIDKYKVSIISILDEEINNKIKMKKEENIKLFNYKDIVIDLDIDKKLEENLNI